MALFSRRSTRPASALETTTVSLILPTGRVWRAERGVAWLRCERGALWVTQRGDGTSESCDILLHQGESVRLNLARDVVAQGMEASIASAGCCKPSRKSQAAKEGWLLRPRATTAITLSHSDNEWPLVASTCIHTPTR